MAGVSNLIHFVKWDLLHAEGAAVPLSNPSVKTVLVENMFARRLTTGIPRAEVP